MQFTSSEKNKDGFILSLVPIVTLILGAGLMASTALAWLGFTWVVRQSQARSAREVAAAGLSRLIEALNRNNAHLLVVDNEGWDDPPLFSVICANTSTGVRTTTGTIDSNDKYTLKSCNFQRGTVR